MDIEQIKLMLRIAREEQNFNEIRRIQKILMFHDPEFSYEKYRRKKKVLGEDFIRKIEEVQKKKKARRGTTA